MVIRELHEKFPSPPIMAISETPRKAMVELTQEFGAVEIVQKPINSGWKPVVKRIRAMRGR